MDALHADVVPESLMLGGKGLWCLLVNVRDVWRTSLVFALALSLTLALGLFSAVLEPSCLGVRLAREKGSDAGAGAKGIDGPLSAM